MEYATIPQLQNILQSQRLNSAVQAERCRLGEWELRPEETVLVLCWNFYSLEKMKS